mgnify:CR=1 FL=1
MNNSSPKMSLPTLQVTFGFVNRFQLLRPVSMSDLHAVATGDIVASTDLPPEKRRQMPGEMREAYTTLKTRNPDALPYSLAIVSGDGWQCYIKDPAQAVAITLQFWTKLRASDLRSRFVLAIDSVDFISERGLNESVGPAFERSGRALRKLDSERRASCVLPGTTSRAGQLAMKGLFELIDLLLHDWTATQAQAVSGRLQSFGLDTNITQAEIAQKWEPEPITRQSVNRHLQRAQWPRLQRTLERSEEIIRDLSPK